MDWLPLALLCAFSLASTDAVFKKAFADFSSGQLVVVRFALPALLMLPALAIAPPQAPPLAFWGWVAAAVPLEIAAMALYVVAIRDSPLALTLPYLAFTPVFAVATSWLLLGERVSVQGLGGIALVVAGAWALQVQTVRRDDARTWLAPFSAICHERGSRLMLAVAAIYSVTSVLGKGAMQYMPAASFAPLYFAIIAAAALMVYGTRSRGVLRVFARRSGWQLFAAVLTVVMVLSHFLALERAEVAYMIAVKRTSLLFGIVFGALLFSERGLARHLGGGSLMVAGVALLATG